MWKYFVLGLLTGWLIEWIIDWLYWRRGPAAAVSHPIAGGHAVADPAGARSSTADAPAGHDTVGTDAKRPQTEGVGTARPPIEPNAGTSTSADTPAGRVGSEAALGTEGAVSTSSATLTSTAPVYRQEDLEAIDGIDPKTGALLRRNGITTFGQLAVTRIDELTRIAEDAGRLPAAGPVQAWIAQARLAAAGNWAGLARLQKETNSGGARQPGGS